MSPIQILVQIFRTANPRHIGCCVVCFVQPRYVNTETKIESPCCCKNCLNQLGEGVRRYKTCQNANCGKIAEQGSKYCDDKDCAIGESDDGKDDMHVKVGTEDSTSGVTDGSGGLTDASEQKVDTKSSIDTFYTEFQGRSTIQEAQTKDTWGNAQGSEYDLIRDHTMNGYSILVIQLYSDSMFDFKSPLAALQEKGFTVVRHTTLPDAAQFKTLLKDASQCWVISNVGVSFTPVHIDHLKQFFDSGKGVFIWGDNAPLFGDANAITKVLFGSTMSGNVPGQKTVKETTVKNKAGFLQHLITTGIENLYEGITSATIAAGEHLQPLMWGSANNLVTAYYDKGKKRAIVDGGFTRLYYSWDMAGSGRFVKNAAGWLVNLELNFK